MTDFMSVNQYKTTTDNNTTSLFNKNIQKAIDAVMPMKSQLSQTEFRHLVLYVLVELSKDK